MLEPRRNFQMALSELFWQCFCNLGTARSHVPSYFLTSPEH